VESRGQGAFVLSSFQNAEFLGPAESYFESHDEGTAFTSDGAMEETRSERREKDETIVDRIRLGEISVFVALTQELPDVFTAEILPKLVLNSTLNLAQVNKAYNDAVWSAEGVRSMRAKIKPHFIDIGKGWAGEPMYWAAKHGNIPAVRALLKLGAGHPYYQTVNKASPVSGLVVLHVAAFRGHASLVKFLIEAGADVNVRASNGNPGSASMYTALYAAADRGHTLVVMELIMAGADLNIATSNDSTPLDVAAQNGHDGVVALLIQAGANLHKGFQGWTPLQIAVDKKHEKIVKMLTHFGG
jgi:ankyrin repeat protein